MIWPRFYLSGRRLLGLAVLTLVLPLTACDPQPDASLPPDESLRQASRGKAFLENKDSTAAIDAFTAALDAHESPPALRNLARAQLLARDAEAALAALVRARELEEGSSATAYLSGIALARDARFAEALPHFEAAVAADSATPALRFQLARALQALDRHEEAAEQLREVVRLDPLHTGAHYRLAGFSRKAGDRDNAARHELELKRLRELFGDEARTPEALERCVYTAAELVDFLGPPRPNGPSFTARFEDASAVFTELGEPASRAVAAAVVEVDAAGRPTLFIATVDGRASLVSPGPDGALRQRELNLDLGPLELPIQALAAELAPSPALGPDAAGPPSADVLLLSPGGARLLHRAEDGYLDVTAAAGLAALRATRGAWVDADHDGDLDLLVATPEGAQLWQSNGDGTYFEIAELVGLAEAAALPTSDVAAADLEADVATDLLTAHATAPTRVWHNQRTGLFAERPPPPTWAAARRVLVDELDGDANLDVFLLGEDGIARYLSGSRGVPSELALGGAPTAATLVDADNDGTLELAVAVGSALRLWRHDPHVPSLWREVSAAAGLDATELLSVHELLAVDLDGDGTSDLLALGPDGPRWLRNTAGSGGGQLKLRLVGTKTNPTGIGTVVEVRRGGFRVRRTVRSLPIEIGLDGHSELDAIRTLWTNGIVDNQLDIDLGTTPQEGAAVRTVLEKNVASGSCPYLYAWDGAGYRFVTDLLGNSPLGLSLRRGEPLPADPDEVVEIGPAESFPPLGEDYVLQVTEELREILYLDRVQLLAVDHAPGIEVHPTDQLRPPPFPDSELWALRSVSAPTRAVGDDGLDRSAALFALDGQYAEPGPALGGTLRGATQPFTLELDFEPQAEGWQSPVLLLSGWLQWGDASVNIALSQGVGAGLPAPRLEVEHQGTWQRLDVVVGLPAGKTKTIAIDLKGHLPRRAQRLRLVTSAEVRWDRIALSERVGLPAGTVHAVDPHIAELSWRGFSEIYARAPGHPQTPDFATLLEGPPWETQPRGWVTAYGDALELVTSRDGRLALMAGGDALELRFPSASLPAIPNGLRRTFFFASVGWDKDADPNVIDGDTVEPLPTEEGMPLEDAWRLRYNTRWTPGRVEGSSR